MRASTTIGAAPNVSIDGTVVVGRSVVGQIRSSRIARQAVQKTSVEIDREHHLTTVELKAIRGAHVRQPDGCAGRAGLNDVFGLSGLALFGAESLRYPLFRERDHLDPADAIKTTLSTSPLKSVLVSFGSELYFNQKPKKYDSVSLI